MSDDSSWTVGVERASGHRQPFLAVLTFWESQRVSLQLTVPDGLGRVSALWLVDVEGSCRISWPVRASTLPGLAEAAKRCLLLLMVWQSYIPPFFFFNLLLAFSDVGICSEMPFVSLFKRKHKFFFYFLGNMLVNKTWFFHVAVDIDGCSETSLISHLLSESVNHFRCPLSLCLDLKSYPET